jgi:hypothetical protein
MRRQDIQDATGVITRLPPVGVLHAYGSGAPTNAQAGFAKGCLYQNYNGAAGSLLYLNTGTALSSTWTVIA